MKKGFHSLIVLVSILVFLITYVFAGDIIIKPGVLGFINLTDENQTIYFPNNSNHAIRTDGNLFIIANENGDAYYSDLHLMTDPKGSGYGGVNIYAGNGTGIFVENGNQIGIGTTSPNYPLEIFKTSTITTDETISGITYSNAFSSGDLTGTKVGLKINMSIIGSNYDFEGKIKGIDSTVYEYASGEINNGELIAGFFNASSSTNEGNTYGLYTNSYAGSSAENAYGIYSYARSDEYNTYGGYFNANGGTYANNNYGIYATASGGGTNYAGYFTTPSQDVNVLLLSDNDGTCKLNPESASLITSCSSDASLKKNIRNVSVDLLWSKTLGFNIKEYDLISNGETKIGVIAQELNLTNSELVSEFTNPETNETILMVQTPDPWETTLLIQDLKNENEMLKSELCLKDNTYSWC